MNMSATSSANLTPLTPHNDLHPTARDDTQKEGREQSHRDLRVKHCRCPCETPVLRFGYFSEGGESDLPSFATGDDQIAAGERRVGAD
jgi:hypothetical protein